MTTAPITDEELSAWSALCRSIELTPAPWTAENEYFGTEAIVMGPDNQRVAVAANVYPEGAWGLSTADARFIAMARSAVPRLLDALKDAEQERDRYQSRCREAGLIP